MPPLVSKKSILKKYTKKRSVNTTQKNQIIPQF